LKIFKVFNDSLKNKIKIRRCKDSKTLKIRERIKITVKPLSKGKNKNYNKNL
jgi:hypothetical protein